MIILILSYFRPNIYHTSNPQCESMYYDNPNEKEESIDSEQKHVCNDSVSDIVEEKDEESGPQDLSMIYNRENEI